MKRFHIIFVLFLITLLMSGCKVSASLDKDDAKLDDAPEANKFVDTISYDEFSRYVSYDLVNEAIDDVKMSISILVPNVMTIDSVTIISKDSKTKERIGASKTQISINKASINQTGNQITYIRDDKCYVEQNLKLYDNHKTINFSGKYKIDIATNDKNSIDLFWETTNEVDTSFVSPSKLIELLNFQELMENEATLIKKVKVKGITYYQIEFAYLLGINLLGFHYRFLIAMDGKKFYGLRLEVELPSGDIDDTKTIVRIDIRTFNRKLDVPKSFSSEYDYTFDQHLAKLNQAISSLYA